VLQGGGGEDVCLYTPAPSLVLEGRCTSVHIHVECQPSSCTLLLAALAVLLLWRSWYADTVE
jgi:hypothetical protein